ncbi:hypothetical protein IFR05_010503 [Cadophora sp. M221]|nr:hypothetical protein IFR05_010503 [Cadophora sp. M221]
MVSRGVRNLQNLHEESRIVAVRSWPATIEEITSAIAGTNEDRLKSEISDINERMRHLHSITSLETVAARYGVLGSATAEAESLDHQDHRLAYLLSWAILSLDIRYFVENSFLGEHRQTISSFDTALKELHAVALKVSDIHVLLPSTPMASGTISEVDSSDESPSKVEISPCILAVERKKGLYRNPKLWSFEKVSEMEDRYDNARSLYRGPLFQDYIPSVKSNQNPKSSFPMGSHESQNRVGRKLDIKDDTSYLTFAEALHKIPRKESSMFDKKAQLFFFKKNEIVDRGLDADGQLPRMKLAIRNVVRSSTLLKNLLLDKHNGRLDDEYDIIIYHPDKTLERKSYLGNVAIYANALLHDGEVRTDYVRLGSVEDVDEIGRAAVLTAKYLGFDELEYYRDGLKKAVGEDNYENCG